MTRQEVVEICNLQSKARFGMLDLVDPPSPKLTFGEKRSALYPYYAGYSEAFVEWVFNQIGVSEEEPILDPWNGAGTTTYLANKRGIPSMGVDLNPALATIARARVSTKKDIENVRSASSHSIQTTSAKLVNPSGALADFAVEQIAENQHLSIEARALIVTAAFRANRRINAGSKSKNPTWYATNSIADVELPRCEIRDIYEDELLLCLDLQANLAPLQHKATIKCGAFNSIRTTRKFRFVVTSPPYLTRIDYIKATLPELDIYKFLDPSVELSELRRAMTGTPLVGSQRVRLQKRWGVGVSALLTEISGHSSKASNGYYRNFYARYFQQMYSSFQKIGNLLKPNGWLVMVVQSSYYKEIRVDLADLFEEFAAAAGMKMVERHDFLQLRSMVLVNSRAKASHSDKMPTESAIFFRKL